MPALSEDFNKIEQARKQVVADQSTFAGASNTFADEVMKRVRDARAARGITSMTMDNMNAGQQLGVGGADIRARNQNVDPMAIDAATARERANTLAIISALSEIARTQDQSVTDIIDSGTNTIKAAAEKKKVEATSLPDLQTTTGYDEFGNPTTYVFNPKTGKTEGTVGGSKYVAPSAAIIKAAAAKGYKFDPTTHEWVKSGGLRLTNKPPYFEIAPEERLPYTVGKEPEVSAAPAKKTATTSSNKKYKIEVVK